MQKIKTKLFACMTKITKLFNIYRILIKYIISKKKLLNSWNFHNNTKFMKNFSQKSIYDFWKKIQIFLFFLGPEMTCCFS